MEDMEHREFLVAVTNIFGLFTRTVVPTYCIPKIGTNTAPTGIIGFKNYNGIHNPRGPLLQ